MIRFAVKNGSVYNKHKVYKSALWNLQRKGIHSGQHLQQAGLGKYLVILTPLAVGAGVVAYAKNDTEFRKTLVNTVPGIDSVLKVLLQEEGNAVSVATKSINNATQKVIDAKDTVAGYFGSGSATDEKTTANATPTKANASQSTVIASPPLPSITAPTPVKSSAPATTPPKPPSPKPAAILLEKSETKTSEPIKLPLAKIQPLPTTLIELEKTLEVAAQITVKEYNNAIKVLRDYAEDVKTVVDRVIENSDPTVWSTLKNKTSARDTAVEAAERTAQAAREHIEKLEKHVASISKDVAPEVVEKTRRTALLISDQLNKAKDELYNAKDAANVSERYWKKIEEARNYFVDQVQSLFPGVDLSAKKLNLSKDDIDLFIMHAYSHVLAYQKELQKLHIDGETRLRRALDALKGDDQNEAVNRQSEYLLKKEKQTLNIENQKKIFRIQSENEARLRQQLKMQSQAHADHLNDALNEKEKELRRIFNRELSENKTLFDPNENNDDNDEEYKKIHDEYKHLVDFMLGSFMEELQITPEQFEVACLAGKHNPNSAGLTFHQGLFQQIWAANDIRIFVRMMTQRNVELQLQALDVIERRHLNSTASTSLDEPTLDLATATSVPTPTTEREQETDEITQEELEKIVADEIEDSEKPTEIVDLDKIEKFEPLSTDEQVSDRMQRLNLFFEKENKVDAEDIKSRQEYLRAQRDKIIAIKKKVRTNQLNENVKKNGRPTSAQAAQKLMQGDGQLGEEPMQASLQLRKTLAKRLRNEVVNTSK